MKDLKDLQIPGIPRQTIHIDWYELKKIASELITRLLGRNVLMDAPRSEYYDWSLTLEGDDSLTKKELEKLFKAVGADDFDIDTTYLGEESTQELSQSVSRKLISLLLPFTADASLADDEGVWFIGSNVELEAIEKPTLPMEMPEGETLFDLIGDGVAYEMKVYEDEMCRKGFKEILSRSHETNILHEVSSVIIDELCNYFELADDMKELTVMYHLTRRGIFLSTILRWALKIDFVDVSNYGETEQLIRNFCAAHLKESEASE